MVTGEFCCQIIALSHLTSASILPSFFLTKANQAEPDMHGHMQAPAAHQRPAAGVLPDLPCFCRSGALVMLARVPALHPWAATDLKRFLQWTCLLEAGLLV